MKNATLPPLQMDIACRRAQREFVARALLTREVARRSGRYISSDEMLMRLDGSLAKARANQTAGDASEPASPFCA